MTVEELTNKEKANNAILWIKRLGTTKAKQGKGELGDSVRGYCCLGYACKTLKVPYLPTSAYEESLVDKIGLLDYDGNFEGEHVFDEDLMGGYNSLAEINDELGYSFRRISTFIKKRAMDIFEPDVAKLINKHFEL